MIKFIRVIVYHYITQAFSYFLLAAVITLALASYNPLDFSFNTSTNHDITNLLGGFGAYTADILYQYFGIAAFVLPIHMIFFGKSCYQNHASPKLLLIKIIAMLCATVCISALFGDIKLWSLPAGVGGGVGIILNQIFSGLAFKFLWAVVASLFLCFSLDLLYVLRRSEKQIIDLNFKEKSIHFQTKKKDIPSKNAKITPYITESINDQGIESTNDVVEEKATNTCIIEELNGSKAMCNIPPVSLLHKSPNQNIKAETMEELMQNAHDLVSVLADFGIKGQVIDVHQGPVVTLYEFEPAPGIKSSRVIGLADDIARSLSAISTRIAVIPGRNVLGIELPNKSREFFSLRELIETPEYQNPAIGLPLILGKDIAGKPYIADISKMPHLLVAGTTGSGKSVAINTMIMSLLYRYTPDECRFIMIDPKMLELSAYDGIPHLLTPVVTEPAKAVMALKWAVKEMENRYRLMSHVGVRNISGFNAKLKDAASRGRVLHYTVQTGFDPNNGKPNYESVPVSTDPLPFIVVIVDEMADLMLVAGKEIELSIQRLAQMARAAGIHIIMATQRPSVDVITGVIKANFPSRISFRVTSKIDSRTILGEQGAESLLGMGDMLYMGSGSSITRIHGPFVNDSEVEQVTQYLINNGQTDYITSILESSEPSDNKSLGLASTIDEDDEESVYQKAIQIIQSERKVSISYIQRCLRIGYNRAANIVERMEKDGYVTQANHAGKRTVIMPE